jgi:hypothetical protein
LFTASLSKPLVWNNNCCILVAGVIVPPRQEHDFRSKRMTLWQPKVSSNSAVLAFKELRDWDKVEAALGKRNGPTWMPLQAIVGRGKPKHFVYMGTLFVADDEAWHLLYDDIQHEVEDLLILVNGAPFHIFNVLNVVDCLDLNQSKLLRTPYDTGIGEILHAVYKEEKVAGHFLFTIPQKPKEVLATSAFKKLVERHKLKNITFQEPASPLVGLMKLMQ